ncbi:hypothetical protein N9955_00375 [bacterium]|nr:hypothetical protein [bacterium]
MGTQIVSVDVGEDSISIVYRSPSETMYACNPPRACPDEVIKKVYRAVDGKIVLDKEIRGKHTPHAYVPETIEFPEETE